MHFFKQNDEACEIGTVIDVPAGIDDKAYLLDFYSKAFHFPDWFGHNWDALLDCLRDVKDAFAQVTIRHSDVPFKSCRSDMEAYLDILLMTCTLHKGDVIATFPAGCLAEIDDVLLLYWKRQSPEIATKEDVISAVSRLVAS